MTEVGIEPKKFAEMPIGEIAARLPGATSVFRTYNLDYCCGGASALKSAAERHGIDLQEVETRLAALNQEMVEVSDDPDDLIEFILFRYHETHRRELATLLDLARRVEKAHASHPEAPVGLTDFLTGFSDELESHMQKEEDVLFPMMREGHPMAGGPAAVMMSEHEGHVEALATLENLTHNLEVPHDASSSWRALYAGLRMLSDDLKEHLHTENNVLFPMFSGR